MESIIQMIAQGVDAKSPYTGGHCARVPVLAQMLAEEAGRQTDGPLAAFRFDDEQEWREFRIGAWLHDCGKLVTPEYIVDKATKLEVIYNRIHEVRTRFEVLIRDAEIARLEAVAAGRGPGRRAARLRCPQGPPGRRLRLHRRMQCRRHPDGPRTGRAPQGDRQDHLAADPRRPPGPVPRRAGPPRRHSPGTAAGQGIGPC